MKLASPIPLGRITIQTPQWVLDAIGSKALANSRSKSAEIDARLRETLKREGIKDPYASTATKAAKKAAKKK